jgi:hypothetical protein
MADQQAKQTPLVELLAAVPADVRVCVRDGKDWNAGTTWHPVGRLCRDAAAELRRLVAENERLHQINQSHEMKLSVRGYEIQIADLKAVNRELLTLLKDWVESFVDCIEGGEADEMVAATRAAIAKAEGEQR